MNHQGKKTKSLVSIILFNFCLSHVGMLVNGRGRVGCSDLSSYFGNLLSIPCVALGGEELLRMETGEVAESVRLAAT